MTLPPGFFDGVLKEPGHYPAFDPVLTRRLPYYPDEGAPTFIVIGFGAEEPHPSEVHTQRILVSLKGGPFDGVFESIGADGVQCIVHAFWMVRGLIDELGDRVEFGEPGETGIPRILPAWPSELNKRIEALADAESERWHTEDFKAWRAAHRDDFKTRRPWPER
ncbi:MAG: hypothetical protein P0Y56_08690 [Candidatus Andeanibacterium colombiense]|uniref:Uncharacterized protein n=1 Tax=Candidatus Andeanibacterium colombiense TaxID=3121345 RepID=A0AAJ6BPB9_9SPHN|nr:MAG: hypothetical protein P0Y56_08690 [Sphingomonadaceae bacterium]